MMQGPQFQLAAARPLALDGGAAPAPSQMQLPRLRVSMTGVVLTYVSAPFLALFMFPMMSGGRGDQETRLMIAAILAGLSFLAMIALATHSLWKVRASARLLRETPLRLGTAASLDVLRYPAGIRVNKSNVRAYQVNVDVYDPQRGTSERCLVQGRTYVTPGTAVALLRAADGTPMIAAYLNQHRSWVTFPPFKLA